MTRIYLIRHAEAEGNLYRIAQGQYNSLLTDRGWRQVAALQQRFEPIHIDAVYSSDLYRTRATASAIYKAKNLPLICRKDLREIYVGDWEHCAWGQLERDFPVEIYDFRHHLDRWSLPGAETALQVQERSRKALLEIAAENDGKTVAVFSHGYVIRLLLTWLQGLTLGQVDQVPTGDNTAVTLLEVENGEMRALLCSDNSHLQTEAYLAEEKVKHRKVGVESGIWCAPMKPEEAELAAAWGADLSRPEQIRIGHLKDEPVGLLQLGAQPGEICWIYTTDDLRCRGLGVQFIGQAVVAARPMGSRCLFALLPPEHPRRVFFEDYGFRAVSALPDGRIRMEKDISYNPEFLD